MYLFVNDTTKKIHGASNRDLWTDIGLSGFSVIQVAGDAETYAWPNGDAPRCLFDGTIKPDPTWVAPVDAIRDAYVDAKAKITTMAADNTIPLKARQAVTSLGIVVEELLKYLNRQIS